MTKPTFTYVTQDKFNEISNIIANDSKVKQWFAHINEWNSTLPQAINNSKTFNPQALYNWKRQEKEIIMSLFSDNFLLVIEWKFPKSKVKYTWW
ncbi:hypothetical protein [Spiroplasma endosymbiont of Andrena trimmerana]|uniref:hypothetical protein n=1 Tax=Spiroplasma endosymbiont of Andrena trimmerana TaxID=3066316 RepID=UPI0030CC7938